MSDQCQVERSETIALMDECTRIIEAARDAGRQMDDRAMCAHVREAFRRCSALVEQRVDALSFAGADSDPVRAALRKLLVSFDEETRRLCDA